MSIEHVQQIAEAVGGKIESAMRLPDGSGAATVSMPLPKDHWIYGDKSVEREGYEPPPMVLRIGKEEEFSAASLFHVNGWPERITKAMLAEQVRRAARYAVRVSTMNGKDEDFDPDALVQNMVVAFTGYFTDDGLSKTDEWSNPKKPGFVAKRD